MKNKLKNTAGISAGLTLIYEGIQGGDITKTWPQILGGVCLIVYSVIARK